MANKPTAPAAAAICVALAERTGQTFTYPHTFARGQPRDRPAQAGAARARTPSWGSSARDRRPVAVGERDAARVRDDEISGHGSSATWAHNRHHEPAPTSDRPAPKRTTPVVGKRTELARYTVAEGERVVYGQRVDGVVRVTDRPASPGGRAPTSWSAACRPRTSSTPSCATTSPRRSARAPRRWPAAPWTATWTPSHEPGRPAHPARPRPRRRAVRDRRRDLAAVARRGDHGRGPDDRRRRRRRPARGLTARPRATSCATR